MRGVVEDHVADMKDKSFLERIKQAKTQNDLMAALDKKGYGPDKSVALLFEFVANLDPNNILQKKF